MFETPEVLNPFPGLRPFETEETNLFFGRDGQSDELLERLRRTRFLAVVGTSGSGKSSLIRAGLLPALYGGLMGGAGSNWRIAILRPGHDPIGNLARALGEPGVFGPSRPDQGIHDALIETTLRRSWLGLVDATRQARMMPHENLLVVVDQFEELFRFKEIRKAAESTNEAASFVNLLLEASAQNELPIYVVLTMRSDFLGDCSQFMGLPEAINKGQYLIPRLSRDERRAAITGPVAVAGGAITLPLVNRVLNDVGDNPDQLPIMQHAMMRTWDYCLAHRRNGEPLGLEHYEGIGTMSEALSRHADEAFDQLPDERSRIIAERLFKRLTEKGADNREIRRPTRLAEICAVAEATEAEVIAVIDVFRRQGRSFLMPPAGVPLDPESVIDISHESLIRNWKRLQAWVDEEAQSSRVYRRLAEAAVLRREGSEALLQDPALQIALDWLVKNKPNADWARRYHPEFEEATKYLAESRLAREAAQLERERERNAELERERREREQAEIYAAGQARANRNLRLLMVALGLLLLFATATAAYAFIARRRALASEHTAIGLRDEAVKQQKALAAALEIKELAEKERRKADMARNAAEAGRMRAQAAEKAALLDAQEKAKIAEREKIKAQLEATKNKKAKEANDHFREAALYVQRGKYQEAKDYFSSAIEQYEDPVVNSPEAVADATVEIGNLALTIGRRSFAQVHDFKMNNIMGNLDLAMGKYDQAAKIYASPTVNALDKAAATNFSLAMNLLPFANGTLGKNPVERGDDSPGWTGAEGEVPNLRVGVELGSGPAAMTVLDYDPVEKLKNATVKHLNDALLQYRQVFDAHKNNSGDWRAEAARAGMRKAAYQLGNFYLNEANSVESIRWGDARSTEPGKGSIQRREAIRYFEDLLSMYEPNDAEHARLLIWLGGLYYRLGLQEGLDYPDKVSASADSKAAEKYFDRALAAYEAVEGQFFKKEDALVSIADVLKENGQTREANEFYWRALQAFKASKNLLKQADMLYNSGQIYEKRSSLDSALDRYYNAMDAYERAYASDKAAGRPENLFAIGSFFQRIGGKYSYSPSLRAFDLAIKFGAEFKRDDIQIYQARAYAEKGSVLSLQNQPREALAAYKEALAIFDELKRASVGVNGSKEQAAAESDRVRAIIKALESGLKEAGTPKP